MEIDQSEKYHACVTMIGPGDTIELVNNETENSN